jgi:hypothetical protein
MSEELAKRERFAQMIPIVVHIPQEERTYILRECLVVPGETCSQSLGVEIIQKGVGCCSDLGPSLTHLGEGGCAGRFSSPNEVVQFWSQNSTLASANPEKMLLVRHMTDDPAYAIQGADLLLSFIIANTFQTPHELRPGKVKLGHVGMCHHPSPPVAVDL